MKLFRAMDRIIKAQHALPGTRPEMADYRKAADHLARADVAGSLVGKTSDEISREYLAWLAAQEWQE